MAAASRAAAAAEVLDNVRQKHLVSAARWDGLAQAKLRMDAFRAQRIAERSPLAAVADGRSPGVDEDGQHDS